MLTTYAPEMDSLIVDLDKVLDDFEAEEKASSHFPGQELKPSDFANYVAEKEDRPWEDLNKAPFSSDPSWKLYSTNDKLSSIDYDVPYSPAEDFDLSEADFAPSVITNQNNLYKDTHKQENFVSKEVNNHVTLNHNGVVENSQSIYENNRFIGNDKTALLNEKVSEHDVQNLEVKNGHDIPERIVHGGSEFNGTYTQHNKTDQLPNSDSTDAILNNAKSINRPVLLLANYTDETGCKFPIQARDEFTPVYENQPFPPDLAPALQNRETQPTQLYQIPESFSETFVKNDLSDTEKTLAENHIGNPSTQSPPPAASANLYLISNDCSIDSGMNSMEGHHGASFDIPFVNSSQSQPSILHKNETEIPVDNMRSNSNNEATPQPDKMTNKDGCLSDINQDNLKDQQNEDNQVTTPHTSDVLCEETEVKSLTDSQTTPPGDDTRGDVVGFGDFDVEVSDKDLDSYLSEVVLEDSDKTMTTENKASVDDRGIEQMSSLTSVNGAPQLNQMREGSELLYVQNPDISYIQSPDMSYVQSPDMSYEQSSEMSYVQSSDQLQTPAEQAQANQHNSSPGGDVELLHDTATEGDVQNEILGEVRPKESVQPNSLSQPSASFVDSSVSSDLSIQTNDTAMDGNYTDQLMNEKTFKSDSNEDVDMSNTNLDYLSHSTIQVQSRQTYNGDDDDMDEDLRAAIALSLKETTMSSNMEVSDGTCAAQMSDNVDMCEDEEDIPVMRRTQPDPNSSAQSSEGIRPHSWGPSGSDTASVQQQKRPNSLNLPPRGEFSLNSERSQAPYTFPYTTTEEQKLTDDSSESTENTIVPEVVEGTMASQTGDSQEASGASGNTPSPDASLPESAPQPLHHINTTLGKVAPLWIPDAEASVCMGCDSRFTFTKRRHHCRACGKVFCSSCCNLKSRLQYMENKEARVCHSCHEELTIGSHRRGEPKQVMFSDGIRPGGDLTELDGSNEATSRIPHRRSGRSQKKVDRASSEAGSHPVARRLKAADSQRTKCLIPENGLPPLVLPGSGKGEFILEENPDIEKLMPQIKNEDAEPVIFALNTNLQALVKILSLDCCVNRLCWCFTSKGMCTVGQDEIVIVLETLPEEKTIPKDIFCHLHTIYEEAGKGNTVSDMGHTIFNQSFLDSRDHGGFLYIRPTFQCLHKLILPTPPYVFGILLQKWETPWAKVFPIRLLLRLGAEYRYYPCPLISVRNRKPVFFEIGHTIMNLLADFRNFQYMLPQIKGITIHMEDKKTVINFPRNRYDDLMKVVSNSNEHVMAIGAGFSTEADSHLVCIQNDDGNYQTQAINIQNKPRKVTGASFVVFNGALKTSSGLKAKSSIVEDGLMVQISPESMVALKQAMKDMKEYSIGCGSITLPTPDEVVVVQWVREDKNINIGVKSPIDNMAMDGIESIHIPNATDYVGEHRVIRWTDVFFIQNLDSGSNKWEPVDLSRLAETLSNASCIALSQHLDKLKEESLIKIGLRVNIETDKVGYEIGANGDRLPDQYMNDLDNELIPVIHSAASQNHGGSISLELIFHILD